MSLSVSSVNIGLMMNQTDIANYFKAKYGIKIDQTRISRMLNEREEVSSPFAFVLAEEFPEKPAQQWKNATPKELRQAFDQLRPQEEVA